jgi:hypothetical protein
MRGPATCEAGREVGQREDAAPPLPSTRLRAVGSAQEEREAQLPVELATLLPEQVFAEIQHRVRRYGRRAQSAWAAAAYIPHVATHLSSGRVRRRAATRA